MIFSVIKYEAPGVYLLGSIFQAGAPSGLVLGWGFPHLWHYQRHSLWNRSFSSDSPPFRPPIATPFSSIQFFDGISRFPSRVSSELILSCND